MMPSYASTSTSGCGAERGSCKPQINADERGLTAEIGRVDFPVSLVIWSFLFDLRVDRLAALEHFNEGLDLPLPPCFSPHIVQAERHGEAVLRVELLQHSFGGGLG